jgi:NADH dehydrogenase/NADH:ubiquinone oxidoreductase subunit G
MTNYLGVIGNAVAGAGVLIQSEQEAQIQEVNAESARNDARMAVLAASVRVEDIRRDADSFKGTQAAVAAANGVVSTKGSALGLIVKTAGTAERASQREMFAGEVEAAKFITEANIYKRQAHNTRITGAVQALATTLSGTTFQRGSGAGARQSEGRGSFDRGGGSSESAYQSYRSGERSATAESYSNPDFGGDLL